MEANYFGAARRALLEKDPHIFDVDLAKHEETAKKMRAERDAAAPPPGKADLHREYNQLRQRLFDLKQNVKTFEQRTTDAAGRVQLLEQEIDKLLKAKKAAAEADNLKGERTCERAIQRKETELADAKEEFEKNKHWSAQATRALKTFDGAARIAELKQLLEKPLPDGK